MKLGRETIRGATLVASSFAFGFSVAFVFTSPFDLLPFALILMAFAVWGQSTLSFLGHLQAQARKRLRNETAGPASSAPLGAPGSPNLPPSRAPPRAARGLPAKTGDMRPRDPGPLGAAAGWSGTSREVR